LALVALVALIALAGCGGSSGNSDGADGDSPQGKAESAGFAGVHSGEAEIWLSIDRFSPGHPEGVKMRILGTFWGLGKGGLPQFDMAIESYGSLDRRKVKSSGGLLYGGDYAVVNYEGQTYEPGKSTLDEIKSKVEEAQREDDMGNAQACVEASKGLGFGSIANDFQRLPNGETITGTPVVVIKAEIDVPGAIEALVQLMEDSACGAQLERLGVPSGAWLQAAKRSLAGRIGEKQAILIFDKNGVIREMVAKVRGRNAKDEAIHVELHVKLLRVNEPDVSPVTYGEASLQQLLKKFGADEAMVAKADGGEILTGFFRGVVDMVTGHELP
jgi:hypothetical protein